MESFVKIIRPGRVDVGGINPASLFCKIKFDGTRLSITGVEGPKSNGDARGSCGQCQESPLALVDYAPGWNESQAYLFASVWKRWHLNDMRPYSDEMRAAGWHDQAGVPAWGFEYTLTRESLDAKKAAERAAMEALKAGAAFTPTAEQSHAANLPYSVTIWTRDHDDGKPWEPETPQGYERARHIGGYNSGAVKTPERKTLGWLRPSEHPDGLLGRKLNADDPHGYGGKWWLVPVPLDVLQWLASLPETDIRPAWV